MGALERPASTHKSNDRQEVRCVPVLHLGRVQVTQALSILNKRSVAAPSQPTLISPISVIETKGQRREEITSNNNVEPKKQRGARILRGIAPDGTLCW